MNDEISMRVARAETTLRTMTAGDVEAMHGLVLQMSWPHRLVDCALLFDLGNGIVATDASGRMIGAGLWWAFGPSAGTIGTVLVAPEHQGKGIGRSLMAAIIAEAGPRALMLSATAEGLRLYERLGFGRIGLVRQHQARIAGALTGPRPPAVPMRRAVPADYESLCALDAAAFGADRTALIARLLMAGEAWVVDGDGSRATGFTILREFGRGQMIGPVVAANEDEAIALVAAAASATRAGVLRVDIPAHAQGLAAWLTEAGLPPIDTVTTMLRGAWPAAANGVQRFGLALQAVG
jgi:ribosomal protein S18 acetylase RimI-like enzyme